MARGKMSHPGVRSGGVRAQKRSETRRRIAEAGLRLFVAGGYDATTLDDIAAAARISRRNFFHYFKSKEEILIAWQSGAGEAFANALRTESADQAPIDAIRSAFVKLVSRFESDEFRTIDRLLRSTDALRSRKQASYLQQEEALFEALCEIWPRREIRGQLRLVAMASVGTLRLALESWYESGGTQPVASLLEDAFVDLKSSIPSANATPPGPGTKKRA